MRVIAMTTLAAAFCLAAAPATAKTGAPVSASAAVSAKADAADKKVCKRLKVTGTRMTERVCLSKDDWKKVEDQI